MTRQDSVRRGPAVAGNTALPGNAWAQCLIATVVIAGMTGCSHGGDAPTPPSWNRWLGDIREDYRAFAYRTFLQSAVQEFSSYETESDDAGIAANAAAAREMVEATRADCWSESPLVVAAFLLVRTAEPDAQHMAGVVFCDLSRRLEAVTITFVEPLGGKRVEIRWPSVPEEPVHTFHTKIHFRTRIVPVEALVARALPTGKPGPQVIDIPAGFKGEVELPDPATIPTYVSVVNGMKRRSNSVRVTTIHVPPLPGVRPTHPFGGTEGSPTSRGNAPAGARRREKPGTLQRNSR